MQNFRKIQWIVIENFPDGRADGRTRVNSKVPIPTKSGDQKSADMESTSDKNILKKIKSNIPPPRWFSPKNAPIPTENGQTVAFGDKTFIFKFIVMENH